MARRKIQKIKRSYTRWESNLGLRDYDRSASYTTGEAQVLCYIRAQLENKNPVERIHCHTILSSTPDDKKELGYGNSSNACARALI